MLSELSQSDSREGLVSHQFRCLGLMLQVHLEFDQIPNFEDEKDARGWTLWFPLIESPEILKSNYRRAAANRRCRILQQVPKVSESKSIIHQCIVHVSARRINNLDQEVRAWASF